MLWYQAGQSACSGNQNIHCCFWAIKIIIFLPIWPALNQRELFGYQEAKTSAVLDNWKVKPWDLDTPFPYSQNEGISFFSVFCYYLCLDHLRYIKQHADTTVEKVWKWPPKSHILIPCKSTFAVINRARSIYSSWESAPGFLISYRYKNCGSVFLSGCSAWVETNSYHFILWKLDHNWNLIRFWVLRLWLNAPLVIPMGVSHRIQVWVKDPSSQLCIPSPPAWENERKLQSHWVALFSVEE